MNAIALSVQPSLSRPLHEFLWFAQRQVAACLFGILLLGALLFTRTWESDAILSRGDFLFLFALSLQAALLALRLEHPREVAVILVFHLLATLMEWFKTSPAIGSWTYPAEGVIFRVYQVPLFAGFLYSAVGSYIARAWRLFDLRFTGYPPLWLTAILATLAYTNFFTHHVTVDIRWWLIGASFLLFGRTRVDFQLGSRRLSLPLLSGLLATASAIWIAENLGTWARAWVYPGQEDAWTPVSLQKFWAWYLLMTLSFVLVSLLHIRKLSPGPAAREE